MAPDVSSLEPWPSAPRPGHFLCSFDILPQKSLNPGQVRDGPELGVIDSLSEKMTRI